MKKAFSLFSLYFTGTAKKCIFVTFLMAVLEILYTLAYVNGLFENAGNLGILTILLSSFEDIVFFGGAVILLIFLAWNPVSAKGKSNYIMERLSLTDGQHYRLNVLANLVWLLFYQVARSVSAIVQILLEKERGFTFFGPQGTYLSIISQRTKNIALPMNNTAIWILISLVILIGAMITASISQNLRRQQTEEVISWES